jgi:hypothetical protein
LRASEKILNSLKRGKTGRGINNHSYNLMTYREVRAPEDPKKFQAFEKEFEDYEKNLTNLSARLNGKSHKSWLSINELPESPADDILYKEYFTLKPRQGQARKFLEVMSKLKTKLGKNIPFKFPKGYDVLLAHNDSLVIHYADEKQGPVIRRIVQKLFEEGGLELTPRTNRVETGFDLKLGGRAEQLRNRFPNTGGQGQGTQKRVTEPKP